MKIETFTYAELRSGPGYNNRRVECSIRLGEGDSPEAAIAEAKRIINLALGQGPWVPVAQYPVQADAIIERASDVCACGHAREQHSDSFCMIEECGCDGFHDGDEDEGLE